MADVRVRFTGKQPIVVNGMTWFQDEIHTVNEKMANALVAMRAQWGDVFVLPAPELLADDAPSADEGADTTGGTDGADVIPVVAPKRKRK